MNVHLIRHPRPRDAAGLCYGRRDVQIDAASLARSVGSVRQELGRLLLDAPIFTSPSTRCVLLARALAEPRVPVPVDALMELDFGSWEGLAWDAIPRGELDAWALDIWRYRPGGRESAAMVAERWRRWCTDLRRCGVSDAIAVTHAGLIRVALLSAGSLTAAAFAQAVIEYGSVHRVTLGEAA
jgi:alpha-ribazole phosphatase